MELVSSLWSWTASCTCTNPSQDSNEVTLSDGADISVIQVEPDCLVHKEKILGLFQEKPFLKSKNHYLAFFVDECCKAIASGRSDEAQNGLDILQMQLDNEEKMIAAAFNKFDTDKSGKLIGDEVQFMLDYLGFPDSKEDVKNLVQIVDSDGDGSVSFDEFLHYVGKLGGSAKLFEVRRQQIRDRGDFKDSAHDPETLRVILQECGISPEAQAHWRLTASESELDSAAGLRLCQQEAIRHIRNLAQENHERALPDLQKRVRKLGYTDTDLWMVLSWIRELAPIIVHINVDKIGKFFMEDSHYRNQFETNTSGGLLKTSAREKWERGLFGTAYDRASAFERPKYGVQNIWNDPRGVVGARQYGSTLGQSRARSKAAELAGRAANREPRLTKTAFAGRAAKMAERSDADEAESNLLQRFEALSKNFRSEVQVLLGQEQEAAKDLAQLRLRNVELEELLLAKTQEAQKALSAIRAVSGQDSESGDLVSMVDALIEASRAQVRPEVLQAQAELSELKAQLEAEREEGQGLREQLEEAQKLKSQEEKELSEFKALREKENELQMSKIQVQKLRGELDETQADLRQLEQRLAQQAQIIQEQSEKVASVVKQRDQEVEHARLLADENNSLRLELGRDTDYLKVVSAPRDPLSYRCDAGQLDEELTAEDGRFREELRTMAAKFPGLAGHSAWCELQIARASELHQSFLHRLQDCRKEFPEDVKVEFTTPTEEVHKDWLQQEALMSQAGAEFQDGEQEHNRRWEEHRLKLTEERDGKVKQLVDQAERSQSKAEKQLLLHQAKLYGQRIDGQLERAWEEQRKERELRWAQHQHQKQELRQKIKEESLAVVQRAEAEAFASAKFAEAAAKKLATLEDAFLRNAEKAAALNGSSLKGKDLESCLQQLRNTVQNAAVSLSCSSLPSGAKQLPARHSQHTGVGLAVDQMEELLQNRALLRTFLRKELEQQSLQQLRSCMERFCYGEKEEMDSKHAAAIASLLLMRQHRNLADVMRRQFADFLLVLRLCSLAAQWLLPTEVRPNCEHLPPLEDPQEAHDEGDALYQTLCQKMLHRALRILTEQQREELLSLKRDASAEIRATLQQLCQLEPEVLEKATRRDVKEFQVQVAARLLFDCERQIKEEHKRQASRVNQNVDLQIARYKREIQEEEQSIILERRKWLMDRIVVLQNGTGSDRALARLRAELRACDAKTTRAPAPAPQTPRRHELRESVEVWPLRSEKLEPLGSPLLAPGKARPRTKLPPVPLTAR
ncbi:unnamed protein product [Effrenium voratum]|nr:unnamed protein product [Effrenium voratum]